MLNQITYRILSVVVLVGLLFIIVPMLFDSAIRYQTVAAVSPPALPNIAVTAEPQQPTILTPAVAGVNKIIAPAAAYTVQVASFEDAVVSRQLVALLEKDGLSTYSQSSGASGLTKVFVGPFLKKEQADALAVQLTQRYKVKPAIMNYNPLE